MRHFMKPAAPSPVVWIALTGWSFRDLLEIAPLVWSYVFDTEEV